ncbi:MAG: VWA domain-containing protein, partial [Deltaproteobacteria bacterium]|nr:VWA domain-containing protein [Deltaproteobacteria bacterium]
MTGVALTAVLTSGACAPDSSATETGGSGGFNLMPDAGDGSFDPDAACAKFEEQGVSKPVNLYVLFDKSNSMAGNKWESAKAGLGAFVDDESSAGLVVALRFFPRDPDTVPACDQQAYKEPTVPFGVLPDNATALKAAMDAEAADGFSTPMYPALGGGILMGIEMAQNHPGESSAVLMVTDGEPEGPASLCGGVDPEDPAEIAALAAIGASYDPPVATYVVGLPGVDQATANLIAEAGGTDSAILVGSTNVEEEFRQALAKVRGDAVPCVYEIPPQVLDGEVTIAQVNVQVWPGDGSEPYIVPQNQACDGEGWRYDDPQTPTEIILC